MAGHEGSLVLFEAIARDLSAKYDTDFTIQQIEMMARGELDPINGFQESLDRHGLALAKLIRNKVISFKQNKVLARYVFTGGGSYVFKPYLQLVFSGYQIELIHNTTTLLVDSFDHIENVTKRRRSIYFTEDDLDLLEYVNQKDIAFNRYLMRLIREDMERDGDITNKQLLLELKEMFPTFTTPSPPPPYPYPYPYPYPALSASSSPSPTMEEDYDDMDGL